MLSLCWPRIWGRLALVATLLLGAAAAADTLPAVGTAASGTIRVLGRTVALPPGPWVVAGAGFGRILGQASPEYGAIGSVMLVRPEDRDPDGFVLIHTNLLPVRDGWGQPTSCSARASLFRNSNEPRDGHMSCGYVHAVSLSDPWLHMLPAVDAARLAGLDFALRLPQAALVAGIRVGDRRDMIDVRYGFRPPAAPGGGGWTRATMEFDSRRAEAVGELAAWTDLARGVAAARLRSEAAETPPLPQPWVPITAQPGERDVPAWRLGIYKMISWRVISSSETFLMAYFTIGNTYASLAYTFWQGITHSAVFYVNEMAWEWPRTLPIADLVALPRGGRNDVAAVDAAR